MSILIVDDNRVSLKIVELNLRKHRYDTITARSGKEAIEILKSNTEIRLLIADIMMPEIDGLELLRRMKEIPELKEIPVIICTALKDIETVQKAIQLGCRHYITKPINPAQLHQKVSEVLGHDKPLLRDKWQVMSHFNLDARSYEEIARTFSGLIKDKIALIERYIERKSKRDVSKDLWELFESASMLGADRLKNAIENITQQEERDSDTDTVTKEGYLLLLEELRLLEKELPSPHSEGDSGEYVFPGKGSHKPEAEKRKSEIFDMSNRSQQIDRA